MDEMRIESKLMRTMAAKWAQRCLRKCLGFGAEIDLHELYVSFDGDKAHVHLNANLDMDKTTLTKLMERIGK